MPHEHARRACPERFGRDGVIEAAFRPYAPTIAKIAASSANTTRGASTSGSTARSASATYIAGKTMTKSDVRISSSSNEPPI